MVSINNMPPGSTPNIPQEQGAPKQGNRRGTFGILAEVPELKWDIGLRPGGFYFCKVG